MQSPKLIAINKQIYNSIQNYKNSFQKSNNKNIIKPFLNLFHESWFSENFSDVCAFFDSIDTKHPDLGDFISSIFYDDFMDKAKSISKVVDFCTNKKINNLNISHILPEVLLSSINAKIINNLGNPEITLNHIRFLSPAKRWVSRSYKNIQQVTPKEKYNNQLVEEEELEYFGHNSMQIESYCESLQIRYNELKKINCNSMAKELSVCIDKVKENLSQKRHGFYRVPISKIINIVSSKSQFDTVEIIPVKDPNYLSNRNCPNFIKICENFFGRTHGIFDHYAEIKFSGINISYLIGEIDSKSYFIGAV